MPFPCDAGEKAAPERRGGLDGIQEEQWNSLNGTLEGLLGHHLGTAKERRASTNANHVLTRLRHAVYETLDSFFSVSDHSQAMGPLMSFLYRHIEHPQVAALLMAMREGNSEFCDALRTQISADGWMAFLGSVSRADMRAFYSYLA